MRSFYCGVCGTRALGILHLFSSSRRLHFYLLFLPSRPRVVSLRPLALAFSRQLVSLSFGEWARWFSSQPTLTPVKQLPHLLLIADGPLKLAVSLIAA